MIPNKGEDVVRYLGRLNTHKPGLTALTVSIMLRGHLRGPMKLRPFLTILTVLGMAVLLFLPADIRAAATSVAPPPGQTR